MTPGTNYKTLARLCVDFQAPYDRLLKLAERCEIPAAFSIDGVAHYDETGADELWIAYVRGPAQLTQHRKEQARK